MNGRGWRAADPDLPAEVSAALLHHVGGARSAVRAATRAEDAASVAAARERVGLAKRGLGERGTPWWEQDTEARTQRWTAALAALQEHPAAPGVPRAGGVGAR